MATRRILANASNLETEAPELDWVNSRVRILGERYEMACKAIQGMVNDGSMVIVRTESETTLGQTLLQQRLTNDPEALELVRWWLAHTKAMANQDAIDGNELFEMFWYGIIGANIATPELLAEVFAADLTEFEDVDNFLKKIRRDRNRPEPISE